MTSYRPFLRDSLARPDTHRVGATDGTPVLQRYRRNLREGGAS